LEPAVDVLSLIQHAVSLKKSHPSSTHIDALDAVLGEARLSTQAVADFGHGERLTPEQRAFISAAFIRGIYEEELLAWHQPSADPVLQDYVRKIWAEEVLGRFVGRYTSTGPLPEIFPEAEVKSRRRMFA
jgi:hypothetical protein